MPRPIRARPCRRGAAATAAAAAAPPALLATMLAAALLAPATPLRAAERLSLEQAVVRALAASPRLAAADAEVAARRADGREAAAGRRPRLHLSSSYTRTTNPVAVFGNLLRQESFGAENFAVDRLNEPDALDHWSTGVDLSQPLWTGGRVEAAVAAAAASARAAGSAGERHRQEVVHATVEAYSAALLAHARHAVASRALDTVRADLDLVRDLFSEGLVVESDVLRVEVRESELEEQRIVAAGRVEVTRVGLNLLLGAELDRTWELAGLDEVDVAATSAVDADDAAAVTARAWERRPDLAASEAASEAAARTVDLERAGRRPSIAVGASWEANASTVAEVDGSNWSAWAGLRWTAHDGGARRARIERARAERRAAAARHEMERDRVALEVRQALVAREAAGQRRIEADRAVALAERSLEIVRDRYKEGLVSLVELLDGQTAVERSRLRAAGARRDLLMAEASLALAAGELAVPGARDAAEEDGRGPDGRTDAPTESPEVER